MRTMKILSLLVFGSCAPSLFAACQPADPPGTLEQQLRATYVETVMDASGEKVAQPGCIFVVKKENIAACTSTKTAMRNVYQDGQVTQETKNSTLNKFRRLPHLPGTPAPPDAPADAPSCTGKTRNLNMDEKVYLLHMELKPNGSDTGIVFTVQSCGTCDPAAVDPAHTPYRADVRVFLRKGFMTATDLKQIKRAVGEVLAFPDDAAADSSQQVSQSSQPAAPGAGAPPPAATPAAPATFAPIAPPPPPQEDAAPATANIGVGQTPDQVKAALGQPDKIVKIGSKEIYSYKNLKVTFVDGKVSDVE
jgi:hypothetical protein